MTQKQQFGLVGCLLFHSKMVPIILQRIDIVGITCH